MTQEERRLFLLRALLAEEPRWQDIAIPADAQGQRDLLRSLMNVRPPKAIAPEVLAVQDAYLQEESRRKGIVELSTLNERQSGLYLWRSAASPPVSSTFQTMWRHRSPLRPYRHVEHRPTAK